MTCLMDLFFIRFFFRFSFSSIFQASNGVFHSTFFGA